MTVVGAREEVPGVSVVISNWNGEELLSANLPHVITVCSEYGGRTEIIVVDDASDDASVKIIHERFADSVRIVEHDENKGFGAACSSGVQVAVYPLVLLLNTDVDPLPGLIEPMVRYFGCADTFAVSPLVLSPNHRIDGVSFRIPYLKRGRVHYRRWDWDKVLARLPRPLITLWNSGGSMLVSREKFLELGGFDPTFAPFYGEDEDIGVRAWRRGWRCYVEPTSAVVHPSGRSVISERFSGHEVRLVRLRNSFIFDLLHCPGGATTAWRSLAVRCVREVVRGRLQSSECSNLGRELWARRRALTDHRRERDGGIHLRQVVREFLEHYGGHPPAQLRTVIAERHRDRKRREATYHGDIEFAMAERLHAVVPDAAILDLGCGERKFPGATGVDLFDSTSVDVTHNLDDYPWPIEDGSADMLIASHIVEHVNDFARFLEECYRILRPDGVLVIRCPHFSCRDSYRNPSHVRHLCYDSIELMLDDGTAGTPDLSCGNVPFALCETHLVFRGGIRKHIGRALAARNPCSWEQYWSRVLPAREICWVLRKPALHSTGNIERTTD